MNNTITISKTEYQQLHRIAEKYHQMRKIFATDFFDEPPIADASLVMEEFRGTGLYNKKFLQSLERGLKSSGYFGGKQPGKRGKKG